GPPTRSRRARPGARRRSSGTLPARTARHRGRRAASPRGRGAPGAARGRPRPWRRPRSSAEHPREEPRRDVARLRAPRRRHGPGRGQQPPEPAHDDGETEGREHLIVVEVPDRAAYERLVARDRLLPPREARQALDPDPLAVMPIEE